MLKRCVVMAALALALAPGAARADWLFTPNFGTTFGGDASGNEQFTYGASIGWMGAGIIGWEADLSYTPNFFDTTSSGITFSDTDNVVSWMGNVMVGVPIGGQHGAGFRPYAVGGLGALQTRVGNSTDLFHVDNNEFGFDVGVGAMGFFTDHIGFRGDVRYFRSLQDPTANGSFDLAVGKLDYWRGTAGVTFRW